VSGGPRAARVRVPASTSNLGAGFDCVGFAVDLWLEAAVEVHGGAEVTMRRGGTLTALTAPAAEDLAYTGFAAACALRGRPVPAGLAFSLTSAIPVARGLGSSSAALVAGAALADAALALGCTPATIANLCAGIEGHPDNVAPAVFGGAVLGVPRAGAAGPADYAFAPLAVADAVAFAFAVPEFQVATSAARAILPATIAHRDGVAAAAKSAALVQGLATGDGALLAYALDDVLHAPYRRALVAGYDAVVRAAVGAGAYGATLSGSGSTLLAAAPHERAAAVADAMARAWAACGVSAHAFVQRRPATACLRGD
jgi:homoserine kinase